MSFLTEDKKKVLDKFVLFVKKQLELKTLTKEFRDKVKECEKSLYGSFIEKYFKHKIIR